ncbi:hypothetical protein CI789_12015 [Erwinia persicina]|uniref:hypothetical protein n=1 Tax=Erwinia persicina TaxID=55211 RepID=UPI000E4BADB4|nr:hypothetical protein [Erwinia persicina]AXU95897.1 hypothetical protein CI789_12015 [Erwinia persicina]
MNLEEIKNKLKPKLHPLDIEGVTLYIHRPTARDFEACLQSNEAIILLCVKDENNDPIFSNEDIEGRINIQSIDNVFVTTIVTEVVKLFTDDNADEIEKK